MEFYSSIFDISNNNHKKLWKKNIKEFNPSKEQNFSQSASKLGKEGALHQRHFFIIEHFLCYKRTKEDIQFSGCLDLRWVRVEFEKTENPNFAKEYEFTLLLIRDGKLSRIYMKDEREREIWRNGLRRICTMTDFHERYKSVGGIGVGSYATVIFPFFFSFLGLKQKEI